MKAGKSMKAAARSWKGGKKSPKKSVKRSAGSRPKARAKTGGRKVAKGGINSQKVMKLIRLAALGMPAVSAALEPGISPQGKLRNALKMYTGYDIAYGNFSFGDLAKGWTPYLAAIAVTYGIPKLSGMIRGL